MKNLIFGLFYFIIGLYSLYEIYLDIKNNSFKLFNRHIVLTISWIALGILYLIL